MLAATPAIAQFIRSGLIGYSFMDTHVRMGLGSALGSAIVSYVMSLIGLYIVAFIADSLAPNFDSSNNLTNAFKAVCYSITPVWIAGVF